MYTPNRRKIRLIEGNAKGRHLKKLTCKGTLQKLFICLRPRTPSPLTHCIREDSILIHSGNGGEARVEPERRGEGQQGREQITKLAENTNKTECTQEIQSTNSDKTCRKVPLQFNFLDDDILH
jgi:hypothetical protein